MSSIFLILHYFYNVNNFASLRGKKNIRLIKSKKNSQKQMEIFDKILSTNKKKSAVDSNYIWFTTTRTSNNRGSNTYT